MITGINHITLSVRDLDESFQFYSQTLGFKPLMRHSKGAYFLAGELWFCLEADSETRSSELAEYTYALASFGTLYGLKIGGVTNFALMGALSPIVTSVIAILFLKERPTQLFFLALPLCVFGLLLLVLGKHQISSWEIALSSSALIIGAAFLDAIVFVFSKKLKLHFSAIQYLAITQISAASFMWILQAGVYNKIDSLQNLSLHGWMAAVFVSVVACVLCYSILYWLLNYIDGHRLALFDGLHTISATLFGFIFFNELINHWMLVGGALLLMGLILGNLPKNRKAKI